MIVFVYREIVCKDVYLDNIISKANKNNLKNSIFLSNHLLRLPCGPSYKINDIKNIVKILNNY